MYDRYHLSIWKYVKLNTLGAIMMVKHYVTYYLYVIAVCVMNTANEPVPLGAKEGSLYKYHLCKQISVIWHA